MKKSEVTNFMRQFVRNQSAAIYNRHMDAKTVNGILKWQLEEEYEKICRALARTRLLSAQHNLFRPKPTQTEPAAKRQRIVSAATSTATVDSAGTSTATFTDSTATTTTAVSAAAPSSVSATASTHDAASVGMKEFFLDDDVEVPLGPTRVAAEPDSDEEILAEIPFRGKLISAGKFVDLDMLPDDEVLDV